mgnify:CR=1 FL=1
MFGIFGSGQRRFGGDGHNSLSDGSVHHLALYKSDGCGYCRMVYRAVDQHDVQVEYRDLSDSTHRQELFSTTGRRTVPCLFVDGDPMFESVDIIRWLEGTFGRLV